MGSIFRFVQWQLGIRILQHPVVYKWVAGSRFIVSKGEAGLTGNIYVGLVEFPDMAYLLHVLRKEDLFLDVGANAGSYTLLACASIGSRGVAIEPLPETYSRLQDNINLNRIMGQVYTHNLAVGEFEGELLVTTDLDDMNHAVGSNEEVSGALAVPTTTLNRLLANQTPTFMKIDVEGFERSVLNGATEILEKQELHSVIMELNGSGDRYGSDEGDILRMMADYGFESFSYDPFRRELTSLNGKNLDQGNTIFIRDLELVKKRISSAEKFKILGQYI
jgi:FkbM family methyltransferase